MFDVSNLTEYVKQTTDLMSRATLQSSTVKLIPNIYNDVKYKTRMAMLEVDSWIQAGVSCAIPTSSGITQMLEKDIEVVPLMVVEELNPQTLNKFVWSIQQKPGFNKDIPFESYFITQKILKIQESLEKMLWGAQAKSSTAFAGLKYQFDNDSEVNDVTFNPKYSGNTLSTWNKAITDMLNKLPEAIQGKEDLTLFVPSAGYRQLTNLMFMANLYHVAPENGNSFIYPGTNLTVINTPGITGSFMALTSLSNIHYATDILSEETRASVEYITYNRCSRFTADFKAGINYGWGDYWVVAE